MILEDDGSLPTRRRSPPGSLASFPPRPPLHYSHAGSSGSYVSVPSAASDRYGSAHDFDEEGGYHGENEWRGGGGAGAWGAIVGLRHQRGSRYKVLVGVAGFALLYLVYESLTRPHHHGPPPWGHHRPPPFEDGRWPNDDSNHATAPTQNLHGQPPLTAITADSTTSPLAPSRPEYPIVDLASYVSPRRPVPPTFSDPWGHVTSPSFLGRKLLSPSRFGSSEKGWRPTPSPPEHLPPPARYLLKAFEYAAKVAGRRADGRWVRAGPGMGWDEMTGRPMMVPHEVLKLGREKVGGWLLGLGTTSTVKVSEIGGGKVGKKKVPKVQAPPAAAAHGREEKERVKEAQERRDYVKRAFMHAWSGYAKNAWGHDEVSPVSGKWSDNYNGWGATLVDSLDMLLLLNMTHEYSLARQHVAEIDFTFLVPSGAKTFSTDLPELSKMEVPLPGTFVRQGAEGEDEGRRKLVNSRLRAAMDQHSPTTLSWFETLIRYLGSFLSAYELSGDPLMLDRAITLGDWLLPSFATYHGLAMNRYAPGFNPDGAKGGRVVLAEVGSCVLEMTKLSMLTGNNIYYEAAQRSVDTLEQGFAEAQPIPQDEKSRSGPLNRGRLGALLPAHLDPGQPSMLQGEYTLGGLADSWYEYLIKQAQLTSFSLPQYPRMYAAAMDSTHQHLLKKLEVIPGRDDLAILGNVDWGTYKHDLQHLTCFAGGMLSLGAKLLSRPQDHDAGVNVTNACVFVYESSATGVGGERTTFYAPENPSRYEVVEGEEGEGQVRTPRGSPTGVASADRKQIGRPETIESVFYLYRLTGDHKWQDVGWTMFVSWVEHAITEHGFGTIRDVNRLPAQLEDSQESFVLAETLKYYYLLFSPPDFMSLDDWVFSTEAHPLWIPKPDAPRAPPYDWSNPSSSGSESSSSFPPFDAGTSDFASQLGEGTWVQKWARVQQAAALASETDLAVPSSSSSSDEGDGDAQLAANAGLRERPPGGAAREKVRPSEEELERARDEARERVEMVDKKQRVGGEGGSGGGRGMAGRPE